MKTIAISIGGLSISAELNDSPTAEAIWRALPVEGTVNRWGEEIYFEIPVEADLEETARQDVEVGDLGYWPPGHAFCIFFGPTPVSPGQRPCAASAVNVFGRVLGNTDRLKGARNGDRIRVARAHTEP